MHQASHIKEWAPSLNLDVADVRAHAMERIGLHASVCSNSTADLWEISLVGIDGYHKGKGCGASERSLEIVPT